MEVHAGVVETPTQPRKESKSEILFCSAPHRCYADASTCDGADLSDILLPNGLFMCVVALFKYLGSYVSRNGSDLSDVDARIASASKAFGALSACLFRSTSVSLAAKRTVYEGEILSILLYGSECWLVTARILQRLRVFHAGCLRAMCGVSRKDRLSTCSLTQKLELDSVDNYVFRRQLRWVGHVYLMPFERLPRRMLTSWVAAKRPAGGQLMTFGRSVGKALDNFNINRASWHKLAADRVAWRAAIHGSQLDDGRPTRAAAAATNRRIAVCVTDARASIHDIGASVATSLARTALRDVSASEANTRAHTAPRVAPPARRVRSQPATGARAPLPLRRSARLLPALPASLM